MKNIRHDRALSPILSGACLPLFDILPYDAGFQNLRARQSLDKICCFSGCSIKGILSRLPKLSGDQKPFESLGWASTISGILAKQPFNLSKRQFVSRLAELLEGCTC